MKDHVIQDGPWTFDEEVTSVFDDMLQRSIPQYEVMREAVLKIGSSFVKQHTCIVDLGCSRGAALEPFVMKFGAHNIHVGIEASKPMVEAATERFKGLIASKTVQIRHMDLREKYPAVSASLTLSILTLQFIPIEYRQRIVTDVFRSTTPGGAFILVEKVLGSDSFSDTMLVEHYLDLKRAHGYSEEEIARKRLALEGVLVPVTARWNEDILRAAGFQHVECFWRFLNFAGWIAVREY